MNNRTTYGYEVKIIAVKVKLIISGIAGLLAAVFGGWSGLQYQQQKGNLHETVAAFEREFSAALTTHDFSRASEAASELSWENYHIARAKIEVAREAFDRANGVAPTKNSKVDFEPDPPIPANQALLKRSEMRFAISTPLDYLFWIILFGALAFIVGTVAVFGLCSVLLLVPLAGRKCWYFSLARLRELSNAVRGK